MAAALANFQPGDTVRAVILDINLSKKRISFGIKPSYFEDDEGEGSDGEDEEEDGSGDGFEGFGSERDEEMRSDVGDDQPQDDENEEQSGDDDDDDDEDDDVSTFFYAHRRDIYRLPAGYYVARYDRVNF